MSYNNNPYNFVSLYESVYKRYSDTGQLPHQGKIYGDRFSGTIRCTLKAETPICVSDGKDGFFRSASGKYVIPGSTLKGIVRTNMTMLGFGALRPGEDYNAATLLYRMVATKNDNPKRQLKDYYDAVLGVKSCEDTDPKTQKKISYSVAEKSRSGYIVKQKDNRYAIFAAKHYKINRSTDFAKQWQDTYTTQQKVWYKLAGNKVIDLSNVWKKDYLEGTLLCTGRAINKENRLYLFEKYERKKNGKEVQPVKVLTTDEVLAYQTDYVLREKSLAGTVKGKHMDKKYWELQKKENTPWPIFYNEVDGTGMTFFGRSPFFRVGFKHSLKEGAPKAHREASQKLTLDYPYSMLGFTWKDKKDRRKSFAYRGRISFGDFSTESQPSKQLLPLVLQGPKPSSYPDYSVGGMDYNQDDFRIRGIKQYWIKPPQKFEGEKLNDSLASKLCLMPEGAEFEGQIRFNNLSEDELGLLLWCLKLNDGCYQTIGKGKPYGYGRVSVSIDGVYKDNPEALYSTDIFAKAVSEPLDADELICCYKNHIKAFTGMEVDETLPVRELMTIRSVIRNPKDIRYLSLGEYRTRTTPLPDIMTDVGGAAE